MKVLIKEYMLDMLKSIEMALVELPQVNYKNDEHLELLGTCQDVLINIAENLPEADPLTEQVLVDIDNSCKGMFQLTQFELGTSHWQSEYESLKGLVASVAEKVQRYQVERITAVFMPVLFENWGSMASIYEAAVEDERVNVQVIPVPYSEYGYGGTIADNKWDFNHFKNCLPSEHLVDCNEYDMAKEHPEMVFINDPFDGEGEELRVQPKYFSDEIVGKTDYLVYVSPEYKKAVYGSVADLPGVKNAWKIVAHNEEEQQEMIRGGISEDKIVSCQSARVDAQMQPKEDQVNVVVELKKLDDENDNQLGINLIDEMLKMESDKENICYHWFKDKAFETDVRRGDEELVTKYDELMSQLDASKVHQVTDKKDYQEAVLSGDMYVGQGDSWVADLFEKKGKPVLKRCAGEKAVDKVDFENKPLAGFSKKFVQKGNKVYCFSSKFNGILQLDLNDGVVSVKKGDDDFNKSAEDLYGESCVYGSKISFAPHKSGKVLESELLADKDRCYGKRGVFEEDDYDILCIENFTVLMPQKAKSPIYYINRKTGEVNQFDNNYDQVIMDLEYVGDNGLFVAKTEADGVLYRSIITNSLIQSYDAQKAEFRYGTIGENMGQIWDIQHDGRFLWCINNDGTKVSLWNRNKNVISNTMDIMDDSLGEKKPCDYLFIEDNHRWFIAADRKTVVHMDKKGQKRVAIDVDEPLAMDGQVIGFTKKDALYFVVDGDAMVKIQYINKGGLEELKAEPVEVKWDEQSFDEFMAEDETFNMSMAGLREFVDYGIRAKDMDGASNKAVVDESSHKATVGAETWNKIAAQLFSNN